MDLRWRVGLYLGHLPSSNEAYIGVSNGNVVKARCIVRVVEPARWSLTCVERIIGTPEDMTPTEDNSPSADKIERSENPQEFDPAAVDPEARAAREPQSQAREDAGEASAPPPPVPSRGWRRVRVTQKDLDAYGPTDGCLRLSLIHI